MRPLSSAAILVAAIGSLAGVFAACASGGNQPPGQPPTTHRVIATDSHGQEVQTNDNNNRTEVRVHASAASVMAALSQVYPDIGIPIGTAIAASGEIGNQNYRVPGHRLKTTPLSRVLECGQESVAGSRVDVDEVTINVVSTITPVGDSVSVVSTFMTATARPIGSSSDAVSCSTNGALEKMINTQLQKSLGAS
jgi:hypothetical protein